MPDSSHHDRTEAATPRKREQAWQQGQVAVSPDLASAVTLLAAALGLRWLGPDIACGAAQEFRTVLPSLPHGTWTSADVALWSRKFLTDFLMLTSIIVGLLMSMSVLTTLAQSGVRFSTESLTFNWSRIDPVAGWSKLMSTDSLMRGLLACLKLIVAAGVATAVLWSHKVELRLQAQG
ncbi:MAG: EscU/YscU/HrcU family type III secretion system export apparatus switch protein, partial [Planctomycetaceae bacterium]